MREIAACSKCQYAQMTANNDTLFRCRRRAPVLTNGADGAVFPVVNGDDWCGDFVKEPDGL